MRLLPVIGLAQSNYYTHIGNYCCGITNRMDKGGCTMQIADIFTARASQALALLRIVSAYIFMLHGSTKILHLPAIARFENVQLLSLSGLAGILELVGGILLILGLFTRPVAFILSGEMAFAYFIAHAPRGNALLPLTNGGDAAILFCFIFLYLAATGGGSWSIDNLRSRRT